MDKRVTDLVIKEATKEDGRTRFEAIANTGNQDRDGEFIEIKGWKIPSPLPPLLAVHNSREISSVLGSIEKTTKSDDGLKITASINDEASPQHRAAGILVRSGDLKSLSVGFRPLAWTNPDGSKGTIEDGYPGVLKGRTYNKQELLEVSLVPVPSDPGAIVTGIKGLFAGDMEVKKPVTDKEMTTAEAWEIALTKLEDWEIQSLAKYNKIVPKEEWWLLDLGLGLDGGLSARKTGETKDTDDEIQLLFDLERVKDSA